MSAFLVTLRRNTRAYIWVVLCSRDCKAHPRPGALCIERPGRLRCIPYAFALPLLAALFVWTSFCFPSIVLLGPPFPLYIVKNFLQVLDAEAEALDSVSLASSSSYSLYPLGGQESWSFLHSVEPA